MPDLQALMGDFVLKLRRLRRGRMRSRGIRWSCSGRCCRSIGSVATTWRPRSPTHFAPQLIDAIPIELAVGSIVRRVLNIIRVEDEGIGNSDAEFHNGNDNRITLSAAVLAARARSALRTPSLQILLENIHVTATEDSDKVADKNSKGKKLKHDIIAAIGEMIHEMDTCYGQIVDQALELIHQKCVSKLQRRKSQKVPLQGVVELVPILVEITEIQSQLMLCYRRIHLHLFCEVILTLGSSRTVKEFLLAAKEKS